MACVKLPRFYAVPVLSDVTTTGFGPQDVNKEIDSPLVCERTYSVAIRFHSPAYSSVIARGGAGCRA